MLSIFHGAPYIMPPNNLNNFRGITPKDAGLYLQRRRKEKPLTGEAFIELVGIPTIQYLSQLETGKVDWRNSRRYAAAIIRAIGFTRDELNEHLGMGDADLTVLNVDDDDASQGMQQLEVHPEWIEFPVLGVVAAGKKNIGLKPLRGVKSFVPREHLKKKGIRDPTEVSVYLANGDCMVSDAVRISGKSIGHGDFVAIHRNRAAVEGDMVVFWDKIESKMLVKCVEEGDDHIVFYSLNKNHPPIIRSEHDIHFFGVVVWRGGGV
jgi:transcriptional regulator with XRE-family HTH domain